MKKLFLILFSLLSFTTYGQDSCRFVCTDRNTFIGNGAGEGLGSGQGSGLSNAFFGSFAGQKNQSSNNSFFGAQAGQNNEAGNSNTFLGFQAGQNNQGNTNVFVGRGAGINNEFGLRNVFIGTEAGEKSRGSQNVFVGGSAGTNNRGNASVFIGNGAGFYETGSNKLYIANNGSLNPLIYGDFREGKIGINKGRPLAELHIKGLNRNNTTSTLFLEPVEWNSTGDIAQIRLGDPFHFIEVENRVGMSLHDFNGIFFKTGGKKAQTRMVIDFDGHIGIGTDNPTSTLHTQGDVRLQDLPNQEGVVLTTDRRGNIGVSEIDTRLILLALDSLLNTASEQAQQIEALNRQIQALQGTATPASTKSITPKLYQNKPNPFRENTDIRFYLPENALEATLFIYDLQGSQLKQVNLAQRGEAQVSIQAGSLKAGMYYYALVVDGEEVATKRMLITE